MPASDYELVAGNGVNEGVRTRVVVYRKEGTSESDGPDWVRNKGVVAA